MQNANDLDEAARLKAPIENDMNWMRHGSLATFVAGVANVKAANSEQQLAAISGQATFGIGSDVAHGGGQQRTISDTSLMSVALFACFQDRGDIGLRQLGEPISRHDS